MSGPEKNEYVLICKQSLRYFGLYYFKEDGKVRRFLTNCWTGFTALLFLMTAMQALYQLLTAKSFELTRDCPVILTMGKWTAQRKKRQNEELNEFGFVSAAKLGALYHTVFYCLNKDALHKLFDYMSDIFHFSSRTGLEEKDMRVWIGRMEKIFIFWAATLLLAFSFALCPLMAEERWDISKPKHPAQRTEKVNTRQAHFWDFIFTKGRLPMTAT